MTRLNADARAALRAAEVSQAAWISWHFGDLARTWQGDACGCPDDRCIGYHHDAQDDCGCLTALLAEVTASGSREGGDPMSRTKQCVTCTRDLAVGDSVWQSPITHTITPDGITSSVDYQCDTCHHLDEWVRTVLPTGHYGYVHAVKTVRARMGWTLHQAAVFVKAIKQDMALEVTR